MPARPDARRVDRRGLLAQREHHHHGRYHHLVLALDQHPAERRAVAVGGAPCVKPDQVAGGRACRVDDGAGHVVGLNLGLRAEGRQRGGDDQACSCSTECLEASELHVCLWKGMHDAARMARRDPGILRSAFPCVEVRRPVQMARLTCKKSAVYARHSTLTGRHPVPRTRPKAPQDLAVRFTGGPHAADPFHRRRSADEPHRRCRALTSPAVSLSSWV